MTITRWTDGMSTVDMSERGEQMLRDLPAFYWEDPDMQAIQDTLGQELVRFEEQIDELISNFFPLQADSQLRFWERLLGVSVEPPGFTLEQRRARVITLLRAFKFAGLGSSWEARLRDLLQEAWDYIESHPLGYRGLWTVKFADLGIQPEHWTFTAGSINDLVVTPDGLQAQDAGLIFFVYQPFERADQQIVIRYKHGVATDQVGGTMKWLAANSELFVRAKGGNLEIATWNGATTSIKATTAASLIAQTEYWLVGRVEGNVVTAEIWDTDPLLLTGAPIHTVPYTLAGADATTWGNNVVGRTAVRLFNMGQAARIVTARAMEVGYGGLADYTVKIVIDFDVDSPQAALVERLIRAITPANLIIDLLHDTGGGGEGPFIVDVSQLGNEAL